MLIDKETVVEVIKAKEDHYKFRMHQQQHYEGMIGSLNYKPSKMYKEMTDKLNALRNIRMEIEVIVAASPRAGHVPFVSLQDYLRDYSLLPSEPQGKTMVAA